MQLALVLAATVALSSPAPAAGSSAAPMTRDQAVAFAFAHDKDVVAAEASVLAAASVLAKDRSLDLPQVLAGVQSTLKRQTLESASAIGQFGPQATPNFSQNTAQLEG